MSRDKLTNREYINTIYNEINVLIENNKISLAKKIIAEYLIKFPNSGILKKQLALSLIKEKNYEEALKILTQAKEENVFILLTSIYIKIGNEEKQLELYKKYYQNPYENYNKENFNTYECYEFLKVYLKNKFEPTEPNTNLSLDLYTQNQMCNYNPVLTIDLIKNNYLEGSKSKKEQYFTEDIDIENMFSKVNKYISMHKEKGSIHKTVYERYEFYYPNCGKNIDGEVLNSIEVFTIIGSADILSIIPVKSDKELIIESFENIDKQYYLEEVKPLTKTKKVKTGLERFNQRYKNNY